MNIMEVFSEESRKLPFESYEQYTGFLFSCVDLKLSEYIEQMKSIFATGKGDFKNVLYPDIEIAHDLCRKGMMDFTVRYGAKGENKETEEVGDELMSLLEEFSSEEVVEETQKATQVECRMEELLEYVAARASLTDTDQTPLPLYSLCRKLELSPFAVFCLAAALLSSMQINYASVFQIINQNGGLSAPTIESSARVFYGKKFNITGAYGEMSLCLEKLAPVLDMKVNQSMPFSTVVTPDKRMIDYLFGNNPNRPDEKYNRFFTLLTDQSKLDPIMANHNQLESLEISYEGGVRIFSLWGDEGSGRKFFIRHFCIGHNKKAVTINCKKLFSYDFSFVERALWAVCRECIFLNALCCLDSLSYHEEEKEKFFGYLDLAFARLMEQSITVFTISEEKLPLREATTLEYTQLELPTPNNYERLDLWNYYSKDYTLNEDVDLDEMATKFLFTAGKIKNALHQGKSLSAMKKQDKVVRACLFDGCYNQMKHELTQKATKIKATYTWEDIVMPPDQRETLEHVVEQMKYRKQVYEQWDYNRKYPYGRGLSVLLFGAPGTGKSMCAQVIANALNLELYRVDLSKVIDKYVGETEKSISMIFREAKKCNVVLFFDECDTLFGKRSDSGGSGESANNNKTAHLLQEVEAYDGVTVLATNYKHNIDPAFFRRMKFIVEFQFPDPETRYRIWEATVPKNTPLGEDVNLRFLAERFEFVGGNIKNCILNAAFLAAADGDGSEVCMKHYLWAIRYEFVKTGKVFTKADFEPYGKLVGL